MTFVFGLYIFGKEELDPVCPLVPTVIGRSSFKRDGRNDEEQKAKFCNDNVD